jgi:hypothetical protein
MPRGLPKNKTPWCDLDRKLTTLRPGNLEDQADDDRDELFSDPTPYFSLANNYGLHKDQYEQFRDGSKVAFRPIVGGPDMKTIRRTRGHAGSPPNPNRDIDAIAPANVTPRGGGGGKKRKR